MLVSFCAVVAQSCFSLDVQMNDKSILYSPYNWGVDGSQAKTINPGAYFKVIIGGNSAVVHTDTSAVAEPSPQFWTRVDGGPLEQHVLAPGSPSFNVSLGPSDACVLAQGHHLLEVIVKSTTETKSRWEPQSTAAVFTGITLDAGAAVAAPRRKKYNILIYGDSITEGVRTLGYQGIQNDTDRNDAVRDYSYQLGQQLPAEIGVVAFGATGLTHGGSGGVPALGGAGGSWNLSWKGAARSFAPQPDLVVYNEGTNDGSRNITDLMLAVVQDVQSVAPAARQLLLQPFNGGHGADLPLVAKAAGDRVSYASTAGFYSGADGLHPFGYSHMGDIAPKVAELCLPLLLLSAPAPSATPRATPHAEQGGYGGVEPPAAEILDAAAAWSRLTWATWAAGAGHG
jgi:lysophospholipase L1-like esterase